MDASYVRIPDQHVDVPFSSLVLPVYPNMTYYHIRASLSKQRFTSCNFCANKEVTHLYCRNSLFGKADLD